MKDWFKRHKEQSVIFLLLISLAGACYFEPSLFLDEELREMQEEERREEELIRFRCSCSCRLCEDCQGMSSQDFHNDDVHCRCSCDVCVKSERSSSGYDVPVVGMMTMMTTTTKMRTIGKMMRKRIIGMTTTMTTNKMTKMRIIGMMMTKKINS